MKLYRLFLLIAVITAGLAVTPAWAKPGWLSDYKQAQEQARTDKKLLLLAFIGSDWCGWCIKLEREIFSKEEFRDHASKNLVLLEIDFPRRQELASGQKVQNEQLAEQYEIQGFPTIIVLDGEGKKLGELGYVPGGPSAFIAQLDKLRRG